MLDEIKKQFPTDEEMEEVIKNIPEDWQDSPFHSTTTSLIRTPSKDLPQGSTTKNPPPNFTPLGQLLEEPEEKITWIVDGLLPHGGFSDLVAKPKVGKSTLARQLALAVAQGELFLGRTTTKGPVLYVSLEEKRGEVRSHFKLMGATGIEDVGIYVGSVPEQAHKWLKHKVEEVHPVLIIIDTLFRFVSVSDVNDYAKTIAALSPLLALARDYSVHLLCVHHARKGGGDGADTTLGSTAIFGSVDTSIMLKKADGKRTIETQQRYGVDMEPTILIFDPDSKSATLGGSKEEVDTQKVESAILEFLKLKEEPVGEPLIDEEVDGRTVFKRRALRDLVAKGQVQRTGAGRRGDPFLYSCSLVPDIYMGREKQEMESMKDSSPTTSNSRSQEKVNDGDF